jgi:hypothetical protein
MIFHRMEVCKMGKRRGGERERLGRKEGRKERGA